MFLKPRLLCLITVVLLETPVSAFVVDSQQPSNPAVQSQKATSEAELSEAVKLSLEVLSLYKQGKFDDAIPLAKQALRLVEESLGPGDSRYADAAANLAQLYVATGKFDDAESLLKRAVTIYERDQNRSQKLGKTLDSLALARRRKGDLSKASETFRRAVSVKQRAFGADSLEVAYSLESLADLYYVQKEYARADTTLQRVVGIKEKTFGDSHVEVGRSLERRACVLNKEKQPIDAEKLEARANHILYGESAKKREPILLSQEALECKVVTKPNPEIPEAAQHGRFTGSTTLVIAIEVDESGRVIGANMTGGNNLFKKSAEKAALTAKLRPTVIDGQAVRVKGVMTYDLTVTRTYYDIIRVGPGPP
jgi:tetratricopeptide (TPR) repeat protein